MKTLKIKAKNLLNTIEDLRFAEGLITFDLIDPAGEDEPISIMVEENLDVTIDGIDYDVVAFFPATSQISLVRNGVTYMVDALQFAQAIAWL